MILPTRLRWNWDLMMQVMISSVYSGVNGLLMLQVITLWGDLTTAIVPTDTGL